MRYDMWRIEYIFGCFISELWTVGASIPSNEYCTQKIQSNYFFTHVEYRIERKTSATFLPQRAVDIPEPSPIGIWIFFG